MAIFNMTPHEVRILDDNNEVVVALDSEGIARVSSETKVVDTLNGVPITETVFGEVTPGWSSGRWHTSTFMLNLTIERQLDL